MDRSFLWQERAVVGGSVHGLDDQILTLVGIPGEVADVRDAAAAVGLDL